jgi:hypothetical protein
VQSAAAAAGLRTEVPIREVTLSNGISFYSVNIIVGSTAIEAGLDTGSTGLRILPNTLNADDAAPSRVLDQESFGTGTQYRGAVGRGTLTIGSLAAPATMQLIQVIGCRRDAPLCPASLVPPDQFGMMGLGLPREGFRAIFGTAVNESVDVDSPLVAIGAERWIIELPRPGDAHPGRLILNPTDNEAAGFAMLPTVNGDSVNACITNKTTAEEACGPLLMDTGATAIGVFASSTAGRSWPAGSPATISFFGKDGAVAKEETSIGSQTQAAQLSFVAPAPDEVPHINAGRSPYFAFDVLYEPGQSLIGLRPRPQVDGQPAGQTTALPLGESSP